MIRRFGTAAGLVVLLAVGPGASAGFQVARPVGSLSVDGVPVVVRDGIAGVAREGEFTSWAVGAPTLSTSGGLFLTRSAAEGPPRLGLVQEKGKQAEWSFELVHRMTPRSAGSSEGRSNAHLRVGPEGESFYLIVAHGPHKGWYVAPAPPPRDSSATKPTAPDFRPLALVEHRSAARPFTFVRTVYSVGHK